MKSRSLKIKMSLAVLPLIVAFMISTAYLSSLFFEKKLKEAIANQQSSMLSVLADEIDDKIAQLHRTLVAVARAFPLEALHDSNKARQFIYARVGTRAMFDGGLKLFSPSGILIAETLSRPGRRNRDFSTPEYIRKTIETREPLLSEPFPSPREPTHPEVAFTTPILDEQGNISAILAGYVDLMKGAFLDELIITFNKSGYLYLFNTSRLIIIHPDPERVMKTYAPPGINKLFDKAIEGFDSTGETTNILGIDVLSTFKHMRTKGWILAANSPLSEAYAPVQKGWRYFLVILITAIALTIAVIWIAMKQLMKPLMGLTDHVQNITEAGQALRPIQLETNDEIGDLARSFNTLMAHLQKKKDDLQKQYKFTKTIIDSMSDAVSIIDVRDFRIVGVNNIFLRDMNLQEQDVIGKKCHEVTHGRPAPCLPPLDTCPLAETAATGMHAVAVHEHHAGDGRVLFVEISTSPIRNDDGVIIQVVHAARDITVQKQLENDLKAANEAITLTNETLEQKQQALSNALESIRSLMEQVTVNKDSSVRFENSHLKKCYEVMKCSSVKCECYGKEPMRCWQTAGTYCGSAAEGTFAQKHKNCIDCPVFIHAASDPIYGISEHFSNMMHMLELKNRELQQAYIDLKSAQSQILQQEKMASIGQLAAGIAHEINNPTGFIISNLGSFGKYIDKLSEFIKAQSTALAAMTDTNENTRDLLAKVEDEKRALKIDYVLEDIYNLIKESSDGAQRVRKIVQDLKNFSHIDGADLAMADINTGLESTLNIIWNELKYKVAVKKDFGEIPLTKCNLRQLNQVFMNLLLNAAQAIEKTGEIAIRTWQDNGAIKLSITDTGCGIPTDKLHRIFEPFFTTKEVGKGTGLGLSIAYDIIKKHHGEISVESEVGKGTTFMVKIPLVTEMEQEDKPTSLPVKA